MVEVSGAAKHCTMHRIALPDSIKNHIVQNVNRSEIEKPRSMKMMKSLCTKGLA